MARKKVVAATVAFLPPKDRSEAGDFERQLASRLNTMTRIENEHEEEMAAIKARLESKLQPLRAETVVLGKALHAYATENRDELTKGGKTKTVTLGLSGEMGWLESSGRVLVKNISAAFKSIRKQRIRGFIRVKFELNRKAMLEKPETAKKVSGISIVKGEFFSIRPSACSSRVECDPEGNWSIVTEARDKLNKTDE